MKSKTYSNRTTRDAAIGNTTNGNRATRNHSTGNQSFRNKTRGQLWIPIFLAIGFFFAFPLAELMALGNWANHGFTAEELLRNYIHIWNSDLMISGGVVTFAAALINAVNGFWYLYSAGKVDFYHCLPVKRSRMFWKKMIDGIVYFFAPYVVMEFLAVCIGAMRGYFSLMLMELAMKNLLWHTLMYLMVYFSVVLAISITGNLLMGALMTAMFLLYGPILGNIIEGGKLLFFSTASGLYRGNFLFENAGFYFSPVTLGVVSSGKYGSAGGYLLQAAAVGTLAAAAFFAYTRRPMEAAGKSMVYKFVAVLVEFMIVIPAGLGFGMILREMSGAANKEFWWILGLVSGTILTHGMLQVIYHLDFRRFFAARIQFLIAGACVAAGALIFQFDLLGYDSYIPKYENLKSIAIDWKNLSGRESANVEMTEINGKYQIKDDFCEIGRGQEEYGLLKAILENQEGRSDGNYSPMHVEYTGKFGRKSSRQYYVTTEEIRKVLESCYENGNLKEDKYFFLQMDPKNLRKVEGTFADNASYSILQGETRKLEELVEALRKDVEEADADAFLGVPTALLEMEYQTAFLDGQKESWWFNIYIYPEYERTLAILKETGYPLSIDDMEIESAEYVPVIQSKNGISPTRDYIKVTDRRQLEELKEAMLPYSCDTAWVETDRRVDVRVRVKSKGGTEYDTVFTSDMLILEGKMPSFMEEEIKNAQEENSGKEVLMD